ncbi:Short-chain dehydrogenase [gamma proteobacterium HdN1]|nr:Short-chain dehydrogenase [gamma proteobacterium HdN1]
MAHNKVKFMIKSFENKVAVITGAGSGIGRSLALQLAQKGCHLAISDINEKGLKETVGMIQTPGIKVTSAKLDVANRDAVYAHAEQVIADHGKANIIINNAGVALGETIENMSYENFEWLMNINFWGVVYGTKAFLPHLKAAGEGQVVNISSVFGLIAVPTQSAYNSAKFAVRGFTECLREELEIDNCGVSATCVHPGGIKTGIARNSRVGKLGSFDKFTAGKDIGDQFEKLARTTADEAAEAIINGIRRNKRRVLIGTDARVIDSMQRFLPTGYQKLLEVGSRITRKG